MVFMPQAVTAAGRFLVTVGLGCALVACATGGSGPTAAVGESTPKAPMAAPSGPPDISGKWMPDPGRAEPWPADLPLTPEAKEYMAKFDPDRFDPAGFCMPFGTPRNTLATTSPMEVLQRSDRVYFIFQPNLLNAETRRVYLDGRPVPTGDDLIITWYGTSRGKWEGNALIAETVGIEPQAIISSNGLPHSDALKVTERWSLVQDPVRGKMLLNEMTLEDSKVYTAPIKVKRYFVWAPEAQMREGQCSERLWIDTLWRYRIGEHAKAAREGKKKEAKSPAQRKAGE